MFSTQDVYKRQPMAKASMLVAIASVTTTFNLVGSKQRLSSLLKLSFIIRPPKKANNPKAVSYTHLDVYKRQTETHLDIEL